MVFQHFLEMIDVNHTMLIAFDENRSSSWMDNSRWHWCKGVFIHKHLVPRPNTNRLECQEHGRPTRVDRHTVLVPHVSSKLLFKMAYLSFFFRISVLIPVKSSRLHNFKCFRNRFLWEVIWFWEILFELKVWESSDGVGSVVVCNDLDRSWWCLTSP